MRVVVLGGSGNLGRALRADQRVVCASRGAVNVTDDPRVVARDLSRFTATDAPLLVVNAAAVTDVGACEAGPAPAWRVNATGAGNAAAACALLRVPMVHVSTDYVFGAAGAAPYGPGDPPCPGTAYGRQKLVGERLVLEASGWVVRMSFLPSPFEHARVFSGVRCNKEWVEDAAERLLRFCDALLVDSRRVPRVTHLVSPAETTLDALVLSRYPGTPTVPVEEGAARLPYDYPRDVRLSGAWS